MSFVSKNFFINIYFKACCIFTIFINSAILHNGKEDARIKKLCYFIISMIKEMYY